MSAPPLPHLKVSPGDIAEIAFVCGDPARARQIAALLGGAREVGRNREYETFTGEASGVPVTVASHGVGAAGAAICFEELIRGGARTLVRLGTCGSLVPRLRDGALVVATGAVRRDGVTDRLIPPAYPAIADHRVVAALVDAASADPDAVVGTGIVLTEGAFYPGLLPSELPMWIDAGVLAIEMEVSILLTLAGIRGVRAGAILNVDGYVLGGEDFDPHRPIVAEGTLRMIRAALRAAPALAAIGAGR